MDKKKTEDLDIRNYLPEYYQGIREIDILAEALFCLLDQLKEDYRQLLANQFVQTADAVGIARFEKMIGISTNTTDALETRRQRVLSKIAVSNPFTYRVLEATLKEMCDNGEYDIASDLNTFFMDLKVRIGQKGMLDVLYDTLYTMLPAHMDFYMHNHLPAITTGGTYCAIATRIKKVYEIVDAVDANGATTLSLGPGLATSLAIRKDVLDDIAETLNSTLGAYPGMATSISVIKDITDGQSQKLNTEQILEPVAAVATARIIKKGGHLENGTQ